VRSGHRRASSWRDRERFVSRESRLPASHRFLPYADHCIGMTSRSGLDRNGPPQDAVAERSLAPRTLVVRSGLGRFVSLHHRPSSHFASADADSGVAHAAGGATRGCFLGRPAIIGAWQPGKLHDGVSLVSPARKMRVPKERHDNIGIVVRSGPMRVDFARLAVHFAPADASGKVLITRRFLCVAGRLEAASLVVLTMTAMRRRWQLTECSHGLSAR